jgi:hypothetical protein
MAPPFKMPPNKKVSRVSKRGGQGRGFKSNRSSGDKDDVSITLERIVAALPISQEQHDQLTEENEKVDSNSANDSLKDSTMEEQNNIIDDDEVRIPL